MLQQQCFGSKNVCSPTDDVSCRSASSRRTIYTRSTDTEHRKISYIDQEPEIQRFLKLKDIIWSHNKLEK
jgi:hypothetical protein